MYKIIDFALLRTEYEPILDLKEICNTIEIIGYTNPKKWFKKKRYRQFLKDKKMYIDLIFNQLGRVEFRYSKKEFAYVILKFDNILLLSSSSCKIFKRILKYKTYFTVHNNKISIVVDYEVNKK